MAFLTSSIRPAISTVMFSLLLFNMSTTSSKKTNANVNALFIFGDSLVDAGTNNFIPHTAARANFPPYGETFFHSPTGRFTDGRTLFDFIAAELKIPFPPPLLQFHADISRGINFASGGSGLLNSTGIKSKIIPFSHQVQQFIHFSHSLAKTLGVAASWRLLGQSIFASTIGGNDIGSNYFGNATLRNSTTPEDFIQLLLESYESYLLRLYHGGARKMVVLDIPPLGCTPIARLSAFTIFKGGCFEPANQMAMAYNAKLKKLLYRLNKTLRGATFIYVNSYSFVIDIIQNGEVYGFRETLSACCGAGDFNAVVGCGKGGSGKYKAFLCNDPGEYLFWDQVHPTERVHHLMANKIWSGNSSFVSPFNLGKLIQ